MINGLYGLIMLIGLWSIAFIVFKFRYTKNQFYSYILPTNSAFWLFVSLPLLTQLFIPEINRLIIVYQCHVCSTLFLIVIPIMVQQLLNKKCYSYAWCGVAGLINILFFVAWFLPNVMVVAKILYSVTFLIFFLFFLYVRVSAIWVDSLEIKYLNRFFYSTIFFFPGIFMDIIGFSERYLNGFLSTPWFYLVVVGIVFTLPDFYDKTVDVIDFQQLKNKYGLTSREIELVPLILSGKSNLDIANELHIALSTVKRHVYHVFKKVNVKNRFELAQKLK